MESSKQRVWEVLYTKSAKDEISKLDGSNKRIIKGVIEDKLMTDPLKFGLPLRRNLSGLFKLRVGDFRIIYQIYKSEVTVLIVTIGHRKDVYRK